MLIERLNNVPTVVRIKILSHRGVRCQVLINAPDDAFDNDTLPSYSTIASDSYRKKEVLALADPIALGWILGRARPPERSHRVAKAAC
jgi:hypothetical protein